MRVRCTCTSGGCGDRGGVDVDKRTYDNHSRKDKIALTKKAEEQAECAIQDQLDAIAIHLSSTTLTDNLAPPSSVTGGRLWSKSARSAAEKNGGAESASRQQSIRDLLACLAEIDSQVDALNDNVRHELHILDKSHKVNSTFPLRHLKAEFLRIEMDLTKITLKAPSVVSLKSSVKAKMDSISETLSLAKANWTEKLATFRSSAPAAETGIKVSTDHFFQPILPKTDPILQSVIFLVIACQVVLGASRNGCKFIFGVLQYVVQLCFMRFNPHLTPHDRKILSDFPVDPRPVEKAFRLDPETVIYAVCPDPACQATYAPKFQNDSPIPIYPSRCRRRRTGRKCNTQLLRPRTLKGRVVYTPIKPFVYFRPVDWLGQLLSRPGIEAEMDAAWSKSKDSNDGEMRDIFDGETLRNFKGPDGRHFSLGHGEGRYAFSLSADFFNPLQNKQAGKKISVGLISLVCLNLPPHLRYKAENIFLAGIIPGPTEPPLTAINHFLRPLVDDFLKMWDPGIRYSRTDDHPHGRLVRCAIVCVVCDLPAARKTAGFTSSAHNHFCAICECTLKDNGYGDTNHHAWKRRTNLSCRKAAKKFRRAGSAAESIVATTGVRWSELLRLPYFDPSRFVVVDAMHNLLLGLIHEHFSGILGIQLQPDKEKDAPVLRCNFTNAWTHLGHKEQSGMKRIIRWLEHPMSSRLSTEDGMAYWLKKLSNEKLVVLQLICQELQCAPVPFDARKQGNFRRADYARGILQWRHTQVEQDIDPLGHSATQTKCGHILTKEEMHAIRSDITHLIRPSWLTSVPQELGSASHGKLKADQWRALGTTFLPASLICLWSHEDPEDPRSVRCRKICDVTISLLSAVSIACSRTTSIKHADAYLQHMQSYLEGLKVLFPDYKFRPNHHMSLHLYEYIIFYGPVHSWWTFPFERVIGILQRISTNYKPGQYEATIACSFVRGNNLRNLFHRNGTPEVILNCKPMFQKLVDPQVRDTLVTDILTLFTDDADSENDGLLNERQLQQPVQSTNALPVLLQECLIAAYGRRLRARLLSHLTISGITYSSSAIHLGNALILLKSPAPNKYLPARIDYIAQILLDDTDDGHLVTFVAARKYKPSNVNIDPFCAFPFLQTQLWSRELDSLKLYPLQSIECHFAQSLVSWENSDSMVMISLSREMMALTTCSERSETHSETRSERT